MKGLNQYISNLKTREVKYGYDYRDRLTRIEIPFIGKKPEVYGIQVPPNVYEFVYNGYGMRVKKIRATGNEPRTTIYHYDEAGNVLQETDGSGNLLATYVYAGGQRIAMIKPDGTIIYYHSNLLGSPAVLMDENGEVVHRYHFDPFGNIEAAKGETDNRYRFTGKEQDETGLYYFGARYYDPMIGRFITGDLFPGYMGMPQSLNPYAYCINNPLTFVDPWGLAFSWKAAGRTALDFLCFPEITILGIKPLEQYYRFGSKGAFSPGELFAMAASGSALYGVMWFGIGLTGGWVGVGATSIHWLGAFGTAGFFLRQSYLWYKSQLLQQENRLPVPPQAPATQGQTDPLGELKFEQIEKPVVPEAPQFQPARPDVTKQEPEGPPYMYKGHPIYNRAVYEWLIGLRPKPEPALPPVEESEYGPKVPLLPSFYGWWGILEYPYDPYPDPKPRKRVIASPAIDMGIY
jgi:RHS repeat-associated protein